MIIYRIIKGSLIYIRNFRKILARPDLCQKKIEDDVKMESFENQWHDAQTSPTYSQWRCAMPALIDTYGSVNWVSCSCTQACTISKTFQQQQWTLCTAHVQFRFLTPDFHKEPCRKLLISQKLHYGPSENFHHIWIGPLWVCIPNFMNIECRPGHSQKKIRSLFIVTLISKRIHISCFISSNFIFFTWTSSWLKT